VFGAVTVSVATTGGAAQAGLNVYAFNENTYTGFSAVTDAQGQATLTLPEGNYRFRADKSNMQYWSGAQNHCAVPRCRSAAITVPVFGVLTVSDSTGVIIEKLPAAKR
jgi:hypothetical protein